MSELPIIAHMLPTALQWRADMSFPWRPAPPGGQKAKHKAAKGDAQSRRLIIEDGRLDFADNFLRPSFRLSQFELKPVLRVKGYAQDRVVLTQYFKSEQPLRRKLTARKLGALARSSPLLDKHRKSRRGMRIGGRLRFLPSNTRFTLAGKNFVKDGAHLLEHMSEGLTLFVTLTVPGGTEDAYKAVSVGSGYIVDRFNRWIRYKTDKGYFLYVWEVQKRGAPHLHYMLRLPYGSNGSAFKEEVRAEWRKILLDVSEQCGIDLFQRKAGGTWKDDATKPVIDVRSVWGNCGSYLAKYLSKQQTKSGGSQPWRPGRWWGVSSPLRELVKAYRFDQCVSFRVFDEPCRWTDDIAVITRLFEGRLKRFKIGLAPGETGLSFHVKPGTAKEVSQAIINCIKTEDQEALYLVLEKNILRQETQAPLVVPLENKKDE